MQKNCSFKHCQQVHYEKYEYQQLNVNKLLLEGGNEVLRKNAASTSLPNLIDQQMEVIQTETERWMDICGSSGKAAKG